MDDARTEYEQRDAVIAEARSFIGTPYRSGGRIKGIRGGTDCGQILALVYANAGIRGHIETQFYLMQWMLHQTEELYLEELQKYAREITESEAKPADIVVYKVGKTYSHGAIIIDPWPGTIIHAVNDLGVVYSNAAIEAGLRGVTKKAGPIPMRFFSPW